jgi:hypothetical protein
MNWRTIFIIIIIFVYGCSSAKEQTKINYIKQDSIILITKPNIVYKDDTILTHSFIYTYDTILTRKILTTNKKYRTIKDTIKIYYSYPENILKFNYKTTPDTNYTITKEISVYTTTEKILMASLILLMIIIILGYSKK